MGSASKVPPRPTTRWSRSSWRSCCRAATPTSPTPLGDDDLLKLERAAFMTLIKQPATLARIEHMLETGKPLRN